MVALEFQAIVLAGGRGSRMMEITAGRPKCLLPIGNKPMLWYPLQMLQRVGFQDSMVIVLEPVKTEVQAALESADLRIHVDLVGIPAGEDWGTADSLRFVKEKIKSDVVVVSCDLITNINLHEVVDMFRKHQAAITALYFKPSPPDSVSITPGPKTKQKPERDLVGLDAETSRLVFLASASDFEESVSVSKSVLRKHQHVSMHSRLIDSHLYVIRKWIFEFLAVEKSFSTLKGELLPYIIKKQLSKQNSNVETDLNASIIGVETKKDIFQFATESASDIKIRNISIFNDHKGDMKPSYHGDPIRCYGYIASAKSFGMRTNTIASYCEINRKIKEKWSAIVGDLELVKFDSSSDIKSTQVDDACLVGEQSTLAEKTSFRSCIIGARCHIDPKVRMTNCILMNSVKIQEGCVLSNCVVCDEAEVCAGTELKDCLVGSHHIVPAGGKYANEVLTDADRLMEI